MTHISHGLSDEQTVNSCCGVEVLQASADPCHSVLSDTGTLHLSETQELVETLLSHVIYKCEITSALRCCGDYLSPQQSLVILTDLDGRY